MKDITNKIKSLQKKDPDLYNEFLRIEKEETKAKEKRLEEILDSFIKGNPKENTSGEIYVEGEPWQDNTHKPLRKTISGWDDVRRLHVLEAIKDNDIEKLKKLSPFIHFRDNNRFGLNNYALYYALKVGSDESVEALMEMGVSKELYYIGDAFAEDSVPLALKLALERQSPKVAEILILSGEELHLNEPDFEMTSKGWGLNPDTEKWFKNAVSQLSNKALKSFAITLAKQGFPIGIGKNTYPYKVSIATAIEDTLKKRGIGIKNVGDSPLQFHIKKYKRKNEKSADEPTI